jgi:hypothetical protein
MRDIAMVFQSYALYPHMSVRANIAVLLEMAQLPFWQHQPGAVLVSSKVRMAHQEIRRNVETVARQPSFLTYDRSTPSQPGAAHLGLTDTLIDAAFIELEGLMVSRIEDYNGATYRSPPKD